MNGLNVMWGWKTEAFGRAFTFYNEHAYVCHDRGIDVYFQTWTFSAQDIHTRMFQ